MFSREVGVEVSQRRFHAAAAEQDPRLLDRRVVHRRDPLARRVERAARMRNCPALADDVVVLQPDVHHLHEGDFTRLPLLLGIDRMRRLGPRDRLRIDVGDVGKVDFRRVTAVVVLVRLSTGTARRRDCDCSRRTAACPMPLDEIAPAKKRRRLTMAASPSNDSRTTSWSPRPLRAGFMDESALTEGPSGEVSTAYFGFDDRFDGSTTSV